MFVSLLVSKASPPQKQINSTIAAAKDLDLIVKVSMTKYMTAYCNMHPSLPVYGKPIAHVTDFKYLGSMVASSSSDFKRRRALAWCAYSGNYRSCREALHCQLTAVFS